jgi:2-dehydropantoate 2-reductase
MRYVIYGAGGIGGGIGAKLFQAGREVVLIARGEHLARIQRDGLRLRTPDEDTRLPIPAVAHPAELDWRSDDPGEVMVLLTMKSQDTVPALDALRDAAGPHVPIACVQNGVANERMAQRRFADVYATVVQMPATYLEPGEVILNGSPIVGMLDTGRFPSGVDARVEALCADLEASSFAAQPDPRVMRLKYTKLLSNLGNAVQALCGLEVDNSAVTGELRAEALRCYEAAGIDFATREQFAERASVLRLRPVGEERRGGGSTWQSIVRGTGRVEVDYLNGEIVLLGAMHGVPTPLNRLVRDLAVEAAAAGRAPGWITAAELLERAAATRSSGPSPGP